MVLMVKSFSQLVRDAKELGYTEPDPRDDYLRIGCAEKLPSWAREAGFKSEMKDGH